MLEKGYAMGAGCAKARARDVSFRRKFTCSSHSLDGQTFSGIDLLWIDPKVCNLETNVLFRWEKVFTTEISALKRSGEV